jgi:hypothetical protein
MPAITTLATLKAAAADALVRSDFADRIATCVPLAEAWLNRNLRLRMMEADVPLTATPGVRAIPLPAGFLEPLGLFLVDGSSRTALRFRPDGFETETAAATPCDWTIDAGAIAFPAPCDAAHAFTLRMLQRFALAADGDSNALLAAWPDLYLAALLTVVTGIYLTDDPRLSAWKFSRDELLAEVTRKEARTQTALTTLAADPALLGHRCG